MFFGGIDVTKWQISKEPSDTFLAFKSKAKENSLSGECNYFVDLEEFSSQTDSGMDKRDASKECLSLNKKELRKVKLQAVLPWKHKYSQYWSLGEQSDAEPKGILDLENFRSKVLCWGWTSSLVSRKWSGKYNELTQRSR